MKRSSFPFHKLVQGKIQTTTTLDGEIYISSGDLCKLLEHMGTVAGRLVKCAPHPLFAMQMEIIKKTFEATSEAVKASTRDEKFKQPSAN